MEQLDEQTKLRKYILNDISEDERAAIEERLLTENEFFEELAMAEENLIQDYADEVLAAADRERFEKFFLVSDENRERVNFARALRKYVNETKDARETKKKPTFIESFKAFFFAPVPATLIVLIIAAGVGFLVWQNSSQDSEVLTALNKNQKNGRPTAARITGFDYAPKLEGTRGSDKNENLELVSAKALAAQAVLKDESAENLHTLGLVFLAENNFDEALRLFEMALGKNQNIARLHNDTAAALIEKARQTGGLELLSKAKAEIERAIELDKNLMEAYFNRALVAELLDLRSTAKEAWENYLKLDPSSPWANEAREHLQKLESERPLSKTKEQILQEFLTARIADDNEKAWQLLSRNKEIITGKLIPQQLAFLFVDRALDGNTSQAGEALDALVFAGKVEEEKSGDLFWRDLATYYANVSNDKIPLIKQAQAAYLEGVEFCILKAQYENAIGKFELAQKFYNQAGNSLEPKMIDFLIGYCLNRKTQVEVSIEKLNKLSAACRQHEYRWLNVQSDTWIATGYLTLKKFSISLEKLKNVAEIAKKIDDVFSQQKIFTQLTETYFVMGRFEKAFESIQESLTLGKTADASPREKWRALNASTRFFYKIKNYHAAALFEQEALALALQLKDETFKYASSVDLGLVNSALGNFDAALELIDRGQKISEKFSDAEYRAKCVARTNLMLGHVKRQKQDYAGASANYQQAIDFYDTSDVQIFGYDAHRGLLLSYAAQRNDAAFRTELPKILKIFEAYRSEIIEEQNRNSFFDDQQDVYDIAIDFEFERDNYAEVFNYSEESRSRSLLDMQNSVVEISTSENQPEIRFSPNIATPLKLAQIQAEMPADAQLLQYAVLNDKTLICLLTKENLTVAKTEISSENLKEKVLAYFDLVSKQSDSAAQRKLSAELFNILIGPVREKLDAGKEIFIIPDKVLFKLPFGTLYAEKYLIEDYQISYAPSANVFLLCSKKAGNLAVKTTEALLGIGNPTFNPAEYENALQPLPAAGKEAVEIAKLYENATVFTETDARKDRIKENLKGADVIHFAGHYIVDSHAPLRSALVLAGAKKTDSDLANFEILGESLADTRLIVLSACRTGIEKFYSGEGMIGAARTFLAAGVPQVVASQWAVDSEASKELMIRFHHFRKIDRLPTSEALRRAQLELLRSEKYQQPYHWAAFAAIGGSTKY